MQAGGRKQRQRAASATNALLGHVRWPGRSRSRAMSFERFRRCAQDTKAVKPRAMTHLALRP